MTRVEPDNEKQKEQNLRDTIRKEIKGEMKKSAWRRRLRNCGGCLILFILIVGGLLGTTAYVAAKTGLVKVPFFSRFYHEPKPARIVIPDKKPFEDVFQKQVTRELAAHTGKPITITVREEELTRAVRDLAPTEGDVILSDSQIMILDNQLEFWSRINFKGNNSVISLLLTPKLESGKLSLAIDRVQIGEYRVWHPLINLASKALLNDKIKSFNEMISQSAKIDSLELTAGTIKITGTMIVPVIGK